MHSFALEQLHNCQKQMWKEETRQLSFYMRLSLSFSKAHLEEMGVFCSREKMCFEKRAALAFAGSKGAIKTQHDQKVHVSLNYAIKRIKWSRDHMICAFMDQ